MWKSTDAGVSWSALADSMANLAVTSLAMDPSNSQTIYAGTGEGFFNVDAVRGAGIFKTTNGGTTWTQIASTNNSNFYYVNDVVVSPNSSLRMYAATGQGPFETVNGGTSWVPILFGGTCEGPRHSYRREPRDTVLVACGNFSPAVVSHRRLRAELVPRIGQWRVSAANANRYIHRAARRWPSPPRVRQHRLCGRGRRQRR